MLTLIVITDGRQSCLEQTLRSFNQNVIGDIGHRLLIDDSADAQYAKWLDANFTQFRIVHHPGRRGFAGAIQSAWLNLPSDTRWVFHLEDDFIFNRRIYLHDMIRVLETNPHLAQVALRRQAVSQPEIEAGGVVEMWANAYQDKPEFLEHALFFTTNPSVYPRRIAELGWAQIEHSESDFTRRLLEYGYRFAYFGKRADPPAVHHIGTTRTGTGY